MLHNLNAKLCTQANIVVHEDKHAALCDFGLSRLHALLDHEVLAGFSSQGPVVPQSTGFTATSFGGTLRYLAPELLLLDDVRPTLETDIYAFGCTCAEVSASETHVFRLHLDIIL